MPDPSGPPMPIQNAPSDPADALRARLREDEEGLHRHSVPPVQEGERDILQEEMEELFNETSEWAELRRIMAEGHPNGASARPSDSDAAGNTVPAAVPEDTAIVAESAGVDRTEAYSHKADKRPKHEAVKSSGGPHDDQKA